MGLRRLTWVIAVAALTGCRSTPPPEPAPEAPEPEASTGTPTTWDPWEEAKARGIEFRAVGNEPGWFLEIDEQKWMRLLYAYGERMATTPVPAPIVDGAVTRYRAAGGDHTLAVAIAAGPCSDGMSDLSYPSSVIVTIDGQELRGCGRWLDR